MFTFVEDYEFDWPVTVRYPGADTEEVEASFTARFRLVEEDEMFRAADRLGDAITQLQADREKWTERWVGWTGILLPDGQPLPFSAEVREKLLRQRPIREAIMRAYSDAVIYGGQAEKN